VEDEAIKYQTIDNKRPKGICGSGIIDAVAVLLEQGYINRSGNFSAEDRPRVETVEGLKRYIIADGRQTGTGYPVFINESDIENVVTAKAAIFAAMKILLGRLDLSFKDIQRFYIAGAFGSYINIEHAIAIGLIPDIERDRFEFVGNASIKGAKIVAFYKEALYKIEKIREDTTYYDLMGANDYVEEFQKAMFLPHTDIELFQGSKAHA
jgi:uncharacterized 2Fe-2S/4Fe-4S cluster protein (DUF4445 family)